MTFDYHILFGLATIPLFVVGYGLYVRSIFKGETKPHLFTWLAYALIDGVVFLAQLSEGGGVGSWVLGLATLVNFTVAIISFSHGEKHIRRSDWLCLFGVFLGIGLWWFTDNPIGAVIVLTFVNALALIPTFRKAYAKPDEESVSIWSVDVLKFMFSIAALESRTLTTTLFPLGIIVVNGFLVVMILFRRRAIDKHMASDTV